MSLAKYPPETASILHRDIFCFLKDEEFVSKAINDLDKFPSSKVRQFAKKMESSKSTTRHIKQVASDPQVAQVNLIRHQRTDLPPSKSKQKNIPTSPDQRVSRGNQVSTSIKDHSTRKSLIQVKHTKEEKDVPSVVILNTLNVPSVLLGSSNARPAVNMVILQACATKSKCE